jgi:hypothetical protein
MIIRYMMTQKESSSMRILSTSLTFSFLLLNCTGIRAGVLYNNSTLSGPGTGFVGVTLFDDVLIPSSLNPSHAPLAITRVTVGINFVGGTATFNLWDTAANNAAAPVGTPTLLSTTTVTLAGINSLQVVFGDGNTPLGVLNTNASAVPGFDLLYLGLSSPLVLGQTWQWADGPSTNLPTAYVFSDGTYQLEVVGPPFPPNISYNLIVEGNPVPEANPVPEPLSQVFVTTGLLGWLALRRLKSQRRQGRWRAS